jgi:hypothetical protein
MDLLKVDEGSKAFGCLVLAGRDAKKLLEASNEAFGRAVAEVEPPLPRPRTPAVRHVSIPANLAECRHVLLGVYAQNDNNSLSFSG